MPDTNSAPSNRSKLLHRLRSLLTGSAPPTKVPDAAQRQAARAHHAATRAAREAMASIGILSSQYRCKVLSTLGNQARLALVLNVQEGPTLSATQQGALERKIAAAAAARADVEVIAVYWRWEQEVTRQPLPQAKPRAISEAERRAQAFAMAEQALQKNDAAWAPTVLDDGELPEASNSDLMPLI